MRQQCEKVRGEFRCSRCGTRSRIVVRKLGVDCVEGGDGYVLPLDQTASLLRPLARLALSTLRPFRVDMRLRNPCVRFRETTLG